jgi:hypothetical protein
MSRMSPDPLGRLAIPASPDADSSAAILRPRRGRRAAAFPGSIRPARQAQTPKPAQETQVAADTDAWIARVVVADRASYCSAKPSVAAIMPPRPNRPAPVDPLLCGHHHRASQEGREAAGAVVHITSRC